MPPGPDLVTSSNLAGLVGRARALVARGDRQILGIVGPPGAGKSYLAERVVSALSPCAVLVPMDGFHLASEELARLGLLARKGAPDTFDSAGYVALLHRLRAPTGAPVYAPRFDRTIEEPIAGSIAVLPEIELVVTEGNYLLSDLGEWAKVEALLDETWYLAPDEAARFARLVARHVAFGRSLEEAEAWARTVDQPNAELVATSRDRADVVVVDD